MKLERNFRGWATILKDLEVAIHWSKASCPCNDSNVSPCINSQHSLLMTEETSTKIGEVSPTTSREEFTKTSHIEKSSSAANRAEPLEINREEALTSREE